MSPNNLTGIFERTEPFGGMSSAELAKLLNVPRNFNAPVDPLVASVASVARVNKGLILSEPALYGLAGEIVRVIGPQSEADPAAILMQFLVAFGNIVGTAPHCAVESSHHSLNLFCLLVGESSKARKGTSWNHVRRIFEHVDSGWAANRITDGLSSAEGLINEVRDKGESTDEMYLPQDKRLMVVQGEFASVLRIMAREGNNLSPILRVAWDGGTLRTLVKHDPLKATNAHISMIGHITIPELLKYLSETESHNGFANRLLWVFVQRSKLLPEGGSVPLATIRSLANKVAKAVSWARQEEREFKRNEASRELWCAIYPELSAGLPGLLGAATSRAEAQVLRISAIYAALDCSEVVRVEHLLAGLSVWDYVFSSARIIFGQATGDSVVDRIREGLENAGAKGLSRTSIRDIFKRHTSADRIEQALAQLVHCNLAEVHREETAGRSTEIWTIATKASEATEGGIQ